MTENKFKTLRHIETVRNYLNEVIRELMNRAEQHDQSKLQEPEVAVFEEYTPKLRGITYGSDEYRQRMKEMKPAIDHHNTHNRHHPEHFLAGISGMNLIDLIEMFCDWRAATLRHNDGDLHKSIFINAKRFGYDEDGLLADIFGNTADWFEKREVFNHAEES